MRVIGIIAAIIAAGAAQAGQISFATGWAEQRLSLFSSNDYSFGDDLTLVSDGAVSIAWTRVNRDDWGARAASWRWQVDQSVPPTDLGVKGGDDRNISVYFVFVPAPLAPALEGANIRALLGNDDVRILQYVWGGNHAPRALIASPYGPAGQGAIIALRQAGTGAHDETVDLAADYARAFGGDAGALVGLAVSGDSDDTNSTIRARLGDLVLR